MNGEKLELYEKELSFLFEVTAQNLIDKSPYWFDGAVGLIARIRKNKQIIFSGKMWTAKDAGKQWLEDFEAIVIDKQITKQGIWIKIQVGEYVGEGDILKFM